MNRRSLLAAAVAAPWCLGRASSSTCFWAPCAHERSLVVLELVGGNDGLNTVIPVDHARYPTLRSKLDVRGGALRLADGTALHRSLASLHRCVTNGQATVVHGVGYPGPDRSHFRSRDIWHVADPAYQLATAATTGWLGRAADQLLAASSGVPAAAVGGLEVPLLLKAARTTVPSLRRVEDFQWLAAAGGGPMAASAPARMVVGDAAAGDGVRAFAAAAAREALELADGLAAALARYRPRASYPDSQLARDLQLTARLVIAGFGTRLVHVPFGGFDTHARQLPTHQGLLAELDAAVGAFVDDLAAHERGHDTALLVHSEFGRRAAENASQGTDHGAAAPVFVLLGGAAGGTLGTPPDLDRLVDGDVAATCDFRSVYGDLLGWLGIDESSVLGAPFPRVGLWPRAATR